MAKGWECQAARPGGTVTALAQAQMSDGATVIFAGTAIGPFISLDESQSWRRLGEQWVPPAIVAVAPSPAFERDQTVFLGTRNTLYRSTDGGATWHALLRGSIMLSIALSPDFASDQVIFVGTDTDGIIRSNDAGHSWVSVSAGLLDPTVLSLSLSPQFSDDGIGFAATPFGLYRTRNGGQSWREIELDLLDPSMQCTFISPNFATDGLVLAGTEESGLLRSTDRGTNWERVAEFTDQSVSAISCLSTPDAQSVFIATDAAIYRSRDGGANWQRVGETPAQTLCLIAIHDGESSAVLSGQFQDGIARSTDDGQTWRPSNDGLHARLTTGLLLSPTFGDDQTLFATDLESGVLRSTDGGATWDESNMGLEFMSGLSISPTIAAVDGRTLWAGTDAGLFRSSDGGETWNSAGDQLSGGPIGSVAADANGTIVTIGMDGQATVSLDGGETWTSTGRIDQGFESVSVALSPNVGVDHTLFATLSQPSDDGGYRTVLLRSSDRGTSWEEIYRSQTVGVLPIAIPPTYQRDATLFIGAGKTIVKHASPNSTRFDLGQNLSAITSVAISPDYQNDSTLFAGTDAGIYVTRDAGESFTSWSENLQPLSVVALEVSPDYTRDRLVYAVSLGGTIWKRRDETSQ